MRLLLLTFCFITLSCAHAQEEQDNSPHHSTPSCETYREWTGKNIKDIDLEFLGDRPYRVLYPDSAMTMDYNPNRLNINVDEDGVILTQECG